MGSSHRDASISNDKSGHRKLIDGTAGEALDTLETLKAKIVKTIISGHTWDSHAGQMDTTEKDNSLTTINLTTKGKRPLAPDVYNFDDKEMLKTGDRRNRTRLRGNNVSNFGHTVSKEKSAKMVSDMTKDEDVISASSLLYKASIQQQLHKQEGPHQNETFKKAKNSRTKAILGTLNQHKSFDSISGSTGAKYITNTNRRRQRPAVSKYVRNRKVADGVATSSHRYQNYENSANSGSIPSTSSYQGLTLQEHMSKQHQKKHGQEQHHMQDHAPLQEQERVLHQNQKRNNPRVSRQQMTQPQHHQQQSQQQELHSKKEPYQNKSQELQPLKKVDVCRQPITPAVTIKNHSNCLTDYEQSEVLEYRQVYYFGENAYNSASSASGNSSSKNQHGSSSYYGASQRTPSSSSSSANNNSSATNGMSGAANNVKQYKVQGTAGSLLNHGYDDERGDYNIVIGDHISFRYEVLKVIGKGSFGQVVKCLDHKTGQNIAIKLIRNKKRFHHQAVIEVKILEHINENDRNDDKFIVRMVDYMYFRNHLCIVFELLGDNLYDFIKANNFKGINTNLIRKVATQILVSLKFLNKQNIIHCDLKPENILLCNNKDNADSRTLHDFSPTKLKSLVKMIDFGSSCFTDERVYTYIQSRFYRAPEIILGLPYNGMIDMWSFGCILAELYTGYPLFPGSNETEQLACIMEILGLPPKYLLDSSTRRKIFFDSHGQARHIVNSRGKKRRPGSKDIALTLRCSDPSFVSLIEGCLRWDASQRITPEEAMQHSFIRKIVNHNSHQSSRQHAHQNKYFNHQQHSGMHKTNLGTRYHNGKPLSTRRRHYGGNHISDPYAFSNWESEHASSSTYNVNNSSNTVTGNASIWATQEGSSLLPPIRKH